MLGSSWDKYGIVLGSSWNHVRVILGSSWCYRAITWEISGDHLGVPNFSKTSILSKITGSIPDDLSMKKKPQMRSESKIATNCFPLSLCLSPRETKFRSRGGLQSNVYVLNELFRRDGRIAACSVFCQYWLRMTAELFLRHLGPFMCGACFSSFTLKLSSVVTFNGEAWITACPVVT